MAEDVNVGCGVVFVNYDGKNKFRSQIDEGAFLGSNSNIVAPVHVEKKWLYSDWFYNNKRCCRRSIGNRESRQKRY